MFTNPQPQGAAPINLATFQGGPMQVKLAEDSPYGKQGETVMLALYPSDVHDPTEIPEYLAGYKNDEFWADDASPVLLRNTDNDKFRTFDEDDAFLMVDVKGSINGGIPEVDPKSALRPYAVVDRFVGSFVNSITEQNSTSYNVRQAAGKRCATALGLDREFDVFRTALGTLANWHSSVRYSTPAAEKWNGGASSDPIAALQTRIRASLSRPTDVYWNENVNDAFFNNPVVRDYIKMRIGDKGADIFMGQMAERSKESMTFRVPGFIGINFHLCCAKYKLKSTDTPDYVLGNHVIMTRVPPAGVPRDGNDIATTYTYRRRGMSGRGWDSREFRVEGRGPQGGTMLVVAQADICLNTGTKVGGFIENAYQP